jgi:hypothetical protein
MRWFAPLLFGAALWAQTPDLSKLPDWAIVAAQSAQSAPVPQDAEAWVILDRTEIAYTGDGEIRLRHLRLLKVLEEQGIKHRTFMIFGLGGRASKVKRLKGWNLRPDGEMVKLDSDRVETINDASSEEFSTATLTKAALTRVVKGSWVAFESLESIQSPLGPVADAVLMDSLPVHTWELEVGKQEGWFTNLKSVEVKIEPRHFQPWVRQVEELPGGGMRIRDLPALPVDEGAHPDGSEMLPLVQVRFLDPALPIASMWTSWDAYARWMAETYRPFLQPSGNLTLKMRPGFEGLQDLWRWMRTGLTYKQVYLSPERGWVPEQTAEVGRKRYGDCKDLTAFFLGEAKGLGFNGAPTLARINHGELEANEPPFPRFNHVIAALRLETSLGLPAEVQTSKGRFLLMDPTSIGTPLGYLSGGHANGRVMICLPDGAVWVQIPPSALLPQRMAFDLNGQVVGREFQGALSLRETGGHWGLRGAARQGGTKAVRDHLLTDLLDLPPTASLNVVSTSDPLDLDVPFEVKVSLKHPDGIRVMGQECRLTDLGLPAVRGPIQRAGKQRRFPIQSEARGELTYRAEVKFPFAVAPVSKGREGASPFRSFQWTSQAIPDGAGTLLKLTLDHRSLPVRYGFDALDQGLKAWRQDRTLVKDFRDEALTLRLP